MKLCDPDLELTTIIGRMRGDERGGHDGLRDIFARQRDFWAFIEVTVDDVADHADEWVLASGSTRGRGKGSPSEIRYPWTMAFRIVDGRIVRFGAYLTRADALAATEAG